MWFSAIKLAINAGSKIYANRQKTKMAMSDAQLMHAERQARGEEQYQGKLLEARQNDYKDEVVLLILTLPILVLAWGVWSDDPAAMEKEFQNITKPFYKIDKSRSESKSSVGLGLSISSDIIKSHGGDIYFNKSKLGGLKVTISLPY